MALMDRGCPSLGTNRPIELYPRYVWMLGAVTCCIKGFQIIAFLDTNKRKITDSISAFFQDGTTWMELNLHELYSCFQ